MVQPVLWLAVLWACGTMVGLLGGISGVWTSSTVSAIATLLIFAVPSDRLRPWRFLVTLCAIALFASSLYAYMTEQVNRSSLAELAPSILESDQTNAIVTGTIASAVQIDGDRVSFVLSTSNVAFPDLNTTNTAYAHPPVEIEIQERLQTTVRLLSIQELEHARQWERGDRLLLHGQLRRPQDAGNFGGFDYQNYLRLKRIHWTFAVKGLEKAESMKASSFHRYTLFRLNDRFRERLAERVNSMYQRPSSSGFMKSLLIGLSDEIDPLQYKQFSRLGLTHILAISGLHVAVFVGAWLMLMRRLRITRETVLLSAMLAVPLYVAMTGASPSAVRAGLMAVIALYAARRGWLKNTLQAIGLAGAGMLMWNPYYLLDISFQLSFIVTAGLIAGFPRVHELLPVKLGRLKAPIAVTFVAQAVSLPMTVYYFNQYSLISGLANFFFVPFYSLLTLPFGYAAVLLSFLWTKAGTALSHIIEQLNEWSFVIIGMLDRLDGFHLIVASPPIVWIVVYYALSAAFLAFCMRSKYGAQKVPHPFPIRDPSTVRGRWGACLSGALLCFHLLYAYFPGYLHTYGEIDMIDVGQGDAILVRTPGRQAVLIDSGGTMNFSKPEDTWKQRRDPFEVGNNVVVPLLKKRGITKLDYVMITHQDLDHIGGMQAVLEEIPVRILVFNGTIKNNEKVKTLFRTALSKGVILREAAAGDRIQVDSHTYMDFLLPNRIGTGIRNAQEQNRLSLVFMLVMYESRFLFTGDMEAADERLWLAAAAPDTTAATAAVANPSIDVLKIAHHGSKTSTSDEWLDYWRPKLAVISVGKSNTYGHPNPLVLDRLKQYEVPVLRTDRHGEVQVRVTEKGISVRSKRPFSHQ